MFIRPRAQHGTVIPSSSAGVDMRHRSGKGGGGGTGAADLLLPGFQPAATASVSSRSAGLRRRRRAEECCRRCALMPLRYLFLIIFSCMPFLILLTMAILNYMNMPPHLQYPIVRVFSTWSSSHIYAGRQAPRDPSQLTGLTVALPEQTVLPNGAVIPHGPPYSAAELLEMHRSDDFVYTFVNGTELNHVYRVMTMAACGPSLVEDEHRFALQFVKPNMSACATMALRNVRTVKALLARVQSAAQGSVTSRDRETDELRHSLRSVEQHIKWHRGRVILVSPGHHPTWIDNAKNFLASSCVSGLADSPVEVNRLPTSHLRLITVHQDVILPYGMKFTSNSHVIEQHLWRLRNLSDTHVYFNDDYFVNRDVEATDFFNEYGGTIVRTEAHRLRKLQSGYGRADSWRDGVAHTTLFNVMELDVRKETFLPDGLLRMWYSTLAQPGEAYASVSELPDITSDRGTNQARGNDHWMLTVLNHPPEPLPANLSAPDANTSLTLEDALALRPSYFATHTPFPYCTNLFRFLNVRYEREMAEAAFLHRARSSADLFLPFVYNAFAMERPWAASPQYLRYLWYRHLRGLDYDFANAAEETRRRNALHEAQRKAWEAKGERMEEGGAWGVPQPPRATIVLNNKDGCAPSTQLTGEYYGEFKFSRFSDKTEENQIIIKAIETMNPKFFNINSGATTEAARRQLSDFLENKFSTPIYLERGLEPVSDADRALPDVYAGLMGLPVIAVTSFAEGVCPMVRSLQLALPDHSGVVVPVVARHGTGADVDVTLEEVRADMRHRVWNGMPTVSCAFNDRVRQQAALRLRQPRSVADGASVERLVRTVMAALAIANATETGVRIPANCHSGDSVRVRALVLDGRTASLPIRTPHALRHAVTMPGQSLALEDFEVVPVGDGSGDSVLVLSRQAADVKSVHWIDGAAERDLLLTYPIPYAPYEDLRSFPHFYP